MKNIRVALVFSVFALLASCCKEKGIYRVEAIGSLVGSYTDDYYIEDTTSNFQDAAIFIFPEKEEVIEEGKSCGPRGSFISINASMLNTIEITSEKEIKSDEFLYAKGVSLNPLFKVVSYNQELSVNYFNSSSTGPVSFSSYGSSDPVMILKLVNKPDEIINQKFTIILTFEDGAIFEVEPPIFKVVN